MNGEHIIELIDSQAITRFSQVELVEVREHCAVCASCARAFAAAQISATLLRERVAATFEPSPFFQTRVLASLREQQSTNDWSWSRMWRSAGLLASSMLASVAAIAVLTFAVPSLHNDSQVSLAGNGYSAEEVILNETDATDDQANDAQVLNNLYTADEEK